MKPKIKLILFGTCAVIAVLVTAVLSFTAKPTKKNGKDTSGYVTDPITNEQRFVDPAQRPEPNNDAPISLQNTTELYGLLTERTTLLRAYITNYLTNNNLTPANGFIYVEPGSIKSTKSSLNETEIRFNLIDEKRTKLAGVLVIPTIDGNLAVYFNDSKEAYEITVIHDGE